MTAIDTLNEKRRRRATWVALRVMPHEAQSRHWLRRARVPEAEADDLIQDAYCRLSALEDVEHIDRPGAYFFSIIRNLLIRRRRAASVISLESIAEIESLPDPNCGPEAEVAMRLDAERVRALVGTLPERSRRIVEMRKFEGYSQSEIADLLGITEAVVENSVHRGIKTILKHWAGTQQQTASRLDPRDARDMGLSR